MCQRCSHQRGLVHTIMVIPDIEDTYAQSSGTMTYIAQFWGEKPWQIDAQLFLTRKIMTKRRTRCRWEHGRAKAETLTKHHGAPNLSLHQGANHTQQVTTTSHSAMNSPGLTYACPARFRLCRFGRRGRGFRNFRRSWPWPPDDQPSAVPCPCGRAAQLSRSLRVSHGLTPAQRWRG